MAQYQNLFTTVQAVGPTHHGVELGHGNSPRTGEPLITRAILLRMAVMVPTSAAATLGYFIWRLSTGAPFAVVQTETFTLLAVCQWFNALNCESATRSALRLGLLRNRWLLGGLVLANLLQLAVVYTEPMNRLFHTVPISPTHFFLIGAVASSVLWAEEIRKWFARRNIKKRAADQMIRDASNED